MNQPSSVREDPQYVSGVLTADTEASRTPSRETPQSPNSPSPTWRTGRSLRSSAKPAQGSDDCEPASGAATRPCAATSGVGALLFHPYPSDQALPSPEVPIGPIRTALIMARATTVPPLQHPGQPGEPAPVAMRAKEIPARNAVRRRPPVRAAFRLARFCLSRRASSPPSGHVTVFGRRASLRCPRNPAPPAKKFVQPPNRSHREIRLRLVLGRTGQVCPLRRYLSALSERP